MRIAVVLVSLLAIGCYGNGVTTCDQLACPVDKVCDGHGGCAFQAQLTACANQLDGVGCSYSGVPDGECLQQLCVPVGCGNGFITADEVCDDGNTLNGDGCSADCRSNETCGNGIVDVARGEECDGGEHCRETCKVKLCGDHIIDQPLEACDDGSANSDTIANACRRNCQLARCGDGVVDAMEKCDDGNAQSGDGCSGDCRSDETCGNGIIDAGEQCDDGIGNANSANACRLNCTLPRCGDGIQDSIEACDQGDANGNAPGACRVNCQLARCGDDVTDPTEVCDDGNNVAGDGCTGDCRSTEICGDGVLNVETSESCDCGTSALGAGAACNGYPNSDDSRAPCRTNCTLRRCGDAILEAPEQCEGTNLGGATCAALGFYTGLLACSSFCTFDTVGCSGRCGDGVLSPTNEQCDGNNLGGATCATFGFQAGTLRCGGGCAYDTSQCSGRCGDGTKNGSEQCDGASLGGATCTSIGFYSGTLSCNSACSFNTSACSGRCGDGVLDAGEQCDGAQLGTAACATYGFQGGSLACNQGCVITTSSCSGRCGDGVRNGTEACDTNDFGGTSCQALGYYGGTLACTTGCLLFQGGCSGYCGDAVKNGPEQCDKNDVGTSVCEDFPGLTGGNRLACTPECRLDTKACAVCGDGSCNADQGETCMNCSKDCPAEVCCGNGFCNPKEDPQTCPADCH